MAGDIGDMLAERAETHGDYGVTATIYAHMVSMFMQNRRSELTPEQMTAVLMILMKLARIGAGNPDEADHWNDIIGYATLAKQSSEVGAGGPDKTQ
jgi:hypothetical protein